MSKGAQTRERITELSAQLFNTKGIEGTTLSDIMEITGMEKGGIYNHFDSKEEIGQAAFDLVFVQILQRFKEYFVPEGSQEAKILSIIRFYESLWEEPILEGNYPLIGIGIHAEKNDPILYEKVKQAFSKLEYIISVILQESDTELNSEFLFSSLNGSLFLSFYLEDSHYLYNTTRILKELIKKTV